RGSTSDSANSDNAMRSNHRGIFVIAVSEWANTKTTAGSAGRMKPGSLDWEKEKKSRQKAAQQVRNNVDSLTRCVLKSWMAPCTVFQRNRAVHGRMAMSMTGT